MGKKSAAQIRRLQKRAESRGDVYEVPTPEVETKDTVVEEGVVGQKAPPSEDATPGGDTDDATRRGKAAKKLLAALSDLESKESINSKERRSAKRKAEAIAAEESGCEVETLLKWYEENGGGEKGEDIPRKTSSSSSGGEKDSSRARLGAARKLRNALASLEADTEMNSKERRSAKRKAEAIAAEESGCDAETLLAWFEENGAKNEEAKRSKKRAKKSSPYVLFIGQLSYHTTKEGLFRHFQRELGKDKKEITEEALRIRLLTDSKTGRSRGLAFVETEDPETMYACLQLHHTTLDGRCINVERSAGGKKESETRKGKITQYRKEQEEYMSGTIDKIIADFQSRGDISEGELDEGVVALMKRNSAALVETALAEYVEERGESLDNPSAYLTSIICRIAAGKLRPETKGSKHSKQSSGGRKGGRGGGKNEDKYGDGEDRTAQNSQQSVYLSQLGTAGVDMSISDPGRRSGGSSMSKIFPSMSRGRGRGRGGIST